MTIWRNTVKNSPRCGNRNATQGQHRGSTGAGRWWENIGSNQKPKMSIQRSKDSLIAMFDVCLWQRWWFTQQHKRTRHHCASKVARPDATVSHHVARSTMLKGRSGKRVPLKLGIWANMVNGRQNEFSVHMQSSNTWQEPRNTSKGRSEEP